MMKIAVTSRGTTLGSEVDPRFGRAPYIIIVDTGTLAFEALDNSENVNAFKGAGIQAATTICEKGAEVLLTGYCGPNAFKTLSAVDIKVVNDTAGTVADAVAAFKEGGIVYASSANTEGQW